MTKICSVQDAAIIMLVVLHFLLTVRRHCWTNLWTLMFPPVESYHPYSGWAVIIET